MTLEGALRDTAKHLGELGYRYAVVGGLAASARGEVRFTRDVDLALAVRDDEEAERLLFALGQRGYVVLATVEQDATERLATARLMTPAGVVVDMIFATCGIENDIVAGAEEIEIFEQLHLPTASAEALIAMKVLSATNNRPRDFEDIQAIQRSTPSLNEAQIRQLLMAITSRGYARGQDLASKWETLKKRPGSGL